MLCVNSELDPLFLLPEPARDGTRPQAPRINIHNPIAPTPAMLPTRASVVAQAGPSWAAVLGVEPGRGASSASTESSDRRGSYDRTAEGVNKRVPLPEMAWAHRQSILHNEFRQCSSGASCPYGGRCGAALSENDMLACHNISFGTSLEWDEENDKPTLRGWRTADTQRAWQTSIAAVCVWNGDGDRQETYSVAGKRVCADCMRRVMGIPRSTWDKYLRMARSAPRSLETHQAGVDLRRSEQADRDGDQRQNTSHSDAMIWWLDWLSWEDMMPNEMLVQHRNVLWKDVFTLEYLPWATTCGQGPPYRDVPQWKRVALQALKVGLILPLT